MTTIVLQRHRMIRTAVTRRPDAIVDVSIDLWEKLARELVSIIGNGGFQSLYKRSVHLNIPAFPWMSSCYASIPNGSGFEELGKCLAAQDLKIAGEASTALLITFIDILALLIGELLTSSILDLAWADHASDTVVKELPL